MAEPAAIPAAELPAECIAECSAPVAVGNAVDRWVRDKRVAAVLDRFTPRDLRQYLESYGKWDAADLADDHQNRRRILWLACCAFAAGEDVFSPL